ncbi:methyl-accepting chemotaxis protein McpC [Andreesenia angusta]|uniref:Methyl-accepting chemotaxis protein McpC n=1 Tax=Andreesenia angusta TaxID=39480 RepID=A0A1S1VAT3_9FIRM|nr:methyl-accepting chemotaxis protein [Andreesenia angusta]OHW63347.1 methyl-accepting chemotaxis protein McpC [Andreesenia angusta]
MRKVKLNIGAKVIAITLVLIIIPMILLGVGTYNISHKIMDEQYESLGKAIGSEVTTIVDRHVEEIERNMNNLSTIPALANVLEDPKQAENIYDIFGRMLESYDIQNLYFATSKGDLYLSSIVEGVNTGTVSVEGIAEKEWYKSAVESEDMAWSDAYEDEATGDLVVTVSKSIVRDGAVLGVVGMDISLKTINEIVVSAGASGEVYPIIVDGEGTIIAEQNTDAIGNKFEAANELEDMDTEVKTLKYKFEDKKSGTVQNQLIILKNVDKINWKVATILSTDPITEAKNSIVKTTLTIGLIAGLVATVISVIFGKSISRSIRKVVDILKKMESGDLTERLDIKSEDEFGEVRDIFNSTVESLRNLVGNIKEASHSVGEQSGNLAALSEEVNASSLEISSTSEEIAKGASEQAMDAERGANIVEQLSSQLLELEDISREMQGLVEGMRETNAESTEVIGELQSKTEVNNESTDKVEEEIMRLDEKISSISDILATINDIAEQTNLLALNASIEAARAGEHGKGFAVVADEIRKLAQDSKGSSDSIRSIIDSVQSESRHTVEVVKGVKAVNGEQTEAVFKVGEAFKAIEDLLQDVAEKISVIGKHSGKMNESRADIVNVINNISAVCEETAASSEEVTASIQQQTAATEDVADSATSLNELSNKLNYEIGKFKI